MRSLNDRQQIALRLLDGRALTAKQVGNWIGQPVGYTLNALLRRGLVDVNERGGVERFQATGKGARRVAA